MKNTHETLMIIWGNTLKGAEVYPLTRTEENTVQDKFEHHLHQVMHRDGQQEF